MNQVTTLVFPDLIYFEDYDGNFKSYFDAVYRIFSSHFLKSTPYFEGVRVTAPRYPEVDGLSRTFYHITHQGDNEQNREPDIRRMERIRFPKFKIENHPHAELLIWEKEMGRDIRIHILNVSESYLLVLNRRKDYLLLWTAFYIEHNHTLKKKLKDYEAYKKTKTA
ncbi:MAG: hypothetical protein IT222_13810 [Crocinitomix sp.]|nr:hypothetical protein [Crocinitomix sp.]